MLSLSYDKNNDILYLGLADKSDSYGDEVASGLIVMRDISTDEITGFTIFDFCSKYYADKLSSLPWLTNIDFENDVINKLAVMK